MDTTTYGAHDLAVTPIGLGLAAAGRPGYITLGHDDDLGRDRSVEALERRTHELLDAAWDAGVRYMDVARSYGRAEAFLASWLAAHPDRSPTVGSKWGYTYTGGWAVDADVHEVKDHSLATFTRQFAETRGVLGTALDVYQIHSATLETGVLDDDDVLAALAGLREQGVVVGLSLSGAAQAETLRRALEVEVDGTPLFGSVQATWNVLEPSAGDALAAAHDAGFGVTVKEGVANGRLTPRGDTPALDRLRSVGARHGVGVDAVALAAVLAQPWVDVVLSGATTVEHLRSNLAAATLRLDQDDLDELSGLAEDPAAYWDHRSGLPWQ